MLVDADFYLPPADVTKEQEIPSHSTKTLCNVADQTDNYVEPGTVNTIFLQQIIPIMENHDDSIVREVFGAAKEY